MSLIYLDVLAASVFVIIFLMIFAIGEFIRRMFPSESEYSRKFVHISGGLTALVFPFVFKTMWPVIVLATGFAVFIIFTKRIGMLKSVHGISRRSEGALYFPVAILLLYLLGRDRHVFYIISLLVLTISDTMAALVGTKYGSITFEVEDSFKSLEGSLIFFLLTYLCIHLPLLLMSDTGRLESVLISLIIALLVTGFEAVSASGSDNIFVPLGTFFILQKMTGQELEGIEFQAGLLLLIIIMTLSLTVIQKTFKVSGLIGMILLNFAAWSLCGIYWFLPLLLAQVLLYGLVYFFKTHVRADITGYQIKVFFYTAAIPVILIFSANAVQEYEVLYLPYLVSIVAQISVIFYYFISISVTEGRFLTSLKDSPLLKACICVVVPVVCIAGSIYFIGYPLPPISFIMIIAGVGIALLSFQGLSASFLGQEDWLKRQRARMISVGTGVLSVILMQKVI